MAKSCRKSLEIFPVLESQSYSGEYITLVATYGNIVGINEVYTQSYKEMLASMYKLNLCEILYCRTNK